MQVLHRTCESLYAHISTENKFNDSPEMFRTSGWRCCCPEMKSSGGPQESYKSLLPSAEKCSIFDTQVTPLLLCAQKWRMSGRLQVCYIFLLFGLQFLYGSVICRLEEMFFLLSCIVILHFSPVDMHSCKEQAHLYIGSDVPGDKCPCFVLWLCKMCNLLSWSKFQTIISHEISIASVLVYCLQSQCDDRSFLNHFLQLYPAESSVFQV